LFPERMKPNEVTWFPLGRHSPQHQGGESKQGMVVLPSKELENWRSARQKLKGESGICYSTSSLEHLQISALGIETK
jgi:hypothetical protein